MYWGQPHLWPPHNIFLHLDLFLASSLQSPFSLISSFNTSLHLFLGLPFTPSPSTCSVSILYPTQLISPLNMAKPSQPVSLHDFTNVINCQHVPHTHSLLFLSLKLTPVIHLNILISLLCIFLISSTFVAHVSLPYNITGFMQVI